MQHAHIEYDDDDVEILGGRIENEPVETIEYIDSTLWSLGGYEFGMMETGGIILAVILLAVFLYLYFGGGAKEEALQASIRPASVAEVAMSRRMMAAPPAPRRASPRRMGAVAPKPKAMPKPKAAGGLGKRAGGKPGRVIVEM